MRREVFNDFEQLTKEDLDNIAVYQGEIDAELLRAAISGGYSVLTTGLTISHITADTLRLATGRGMDINGLVLANDNSAFDLLASNASFDPVNGTPASVTIGSYFLVEVQAAEVDGASETRNFIDPNGNTYSQVVVKSKVKSVMARIKVGSPTAAPTLDSGWTKIAEILKTGSGTYTIYNVTSIYATNEPTFYNIGWTTQQQATTILYSLARHRSEYPIDHPAGSIDELHLSADLQAKINNPPTDPNLLGGNFTRLIRLNLLNKALGESRNNKSMEYYFGTGLDTDYYISRPLTATYKENLINDNGLATAVDQYDVDNPMIQYLTNSPSEITTGVLFDVYLGNTEVLHAENTDIDWSMPINTISGGLINLRPQTTWGPFASGADSIDINNLKKITTHDALSGLKKSGVLVDVQMLFQKAAFDAAFNGTANIIVITKDFQVYKWNGVGVPTDALIEANYVFGYEMLLQPSTDGGTTPKPGTTAGQNDAGFAYKRYASNRHRVWIPEEANFIIGEYDSVGGEAAGKYYTEFGTKAYQLKTQVIIRRGFKIDGFDRFLSVIRFSSAQAQWIGWVKINVDRYTLAGAAFSASNPCQITYPSHGLFTGDAAKIESSSDAVLLPNGPYPITKINANTFSIPVDTSAGSPGTATVTKLGMKDIVFGENLSWICDDATVHPVTLDGIANGKLKVFDFEHGSTYAIYANGYSYKVEVHPDLSEDGIHASNRWGKGLERRLDQMELISLAGL